MGDETQAEAAVGTRLGPVEWVERLPSTNTELLRRVAAGEAWAPGRVLATREQTAGRGRQARVWRSGAGRDLTFSFLWPDEPPERLVSLPMAVALGVVDLLATLGIAANTKWPNDVLVEGRKICGLLAETATDRVGRAAGVVVGVGLNVNMTADEAAAIDQPATSIRILTGETHHIEAMLERLWPILNARLIQWRDAGFAAIRADWEGCAIRMHQPVSLHTEAGPLHGILRGYGPAGELRIEVNGAVRDVWSAELV